MSYTPTEWKTGDAITAEKLNNMESGIVGAGRAFLVPVTVNPNNSTTLQKTCGEIKAAIMGGSIVYVEIIRTVDGQTLCVQLLPEYSAFNDGGGCEITVNGVQLFANTDNDYPTDGGR